MEDIKIYKKCLETRFNYHHISFWSSIVAFFTQTTPYDEAIDKIQKTDIIDAFESDAKQLHRDFRNACSKKHLGLEGIHRSKNLVDACE